MPTYGYRCAKCAHEFEIFQSMSATPLTKCPECGGRLGKMLYPVGVQFKGSGFYTTDYRNGKSADGDRSDRESKSEAKSDAKTEGKTEGKTDGKPEAKADANSGAKNDTSSAASGGRTEKKAAAADKE
ncbi:MAG: FmdB family transcriptional regulator [Candidatus Dormibacteraeota bacterium]|nr:FmdB family transcriptional regulator [Candidatus Dormibacteraeota bacterium]